MKLPYRPKTLPLIRSRRFKFIIIHDLSCMLEGIDQIKLDSKIPQCSSVRTYNWILNGQTDVNYHFISERLGEDYETIIGRPINRLCEYNDIPEVYNSKAIHIACMGQLDDTNLSQRYYMQLAYRVIAPQLFIHSIPTTRIYLHSELSTDKDNACPGAFFMKDKLLNAVKAMLIR